MENSTAARKLQRRDGAEDNAGSLGETRGGGWKKWTQHGWTSNSKCLGKRRVYTKLGQRAKRAHGKRINGSGSARKGGGFPNVDRSGTGFKEWRKLPEKGVTGNGKHVQLMTQGSAGVTKHKGKQRGNGCSQGRGGGGKKIGHSHRVKGKKTFGDHGEVDQVLQRTQRNTKGKGTNIRLQGGIRKEKKRVEKSGEWWGKLPTQMRGWGGENLDPQQKPGGGGGGGKKRRRSAPQKDADPKKKK